MEEEQYGLVSKRTRPPTAYDTSLFPALSEMGSREIPVVQNFAQCAHTGSKRYAYSKDLVPPTCEWVLTVVPCAVGSTIHGVVGQIGLPEGGTNLRQTRQTICVPPSPRQQMPLDSVRDGGPTVGHPTTHPILAAAAAHPSWKQIVALSVPQESLVLCAQVHVHWFSQPASVYGVEGNDVRPWMCPKDSNCLSFATKARRQAVGGRLSGWRITDTAQSVTDGGFDPSFAAFSTPRCLLQCAPAPWLYPDPKL
eukprot:CAMPEP_0174340578 /NCGR_PEP_ID=MMETSP0810-20121108/24755_1 /TAXON_ID=73025 ORGANISM="Eutreptiella gymnastica-like, Strain CCMP1594" /NCGR_SAMPLE_ID=MMETSP0810 /ASSEMBLY_ACC=CAM_ASM_000659 /LENGTH=251 /DNA_ID=CAMNT_0015461761 /DNA_START=1466 /DNA_END=2223 /DNA_ORIENTATION=-